MREYTLSGKNMTIVGSNTLAFLNPAAGRAIEITQVDVSQFGTAVAQQIGIEVGTKVSAFPTLVSTTPAKTKGSDAVSSIVGGTAGAAGTGGVNASAEGAGAITTTWPDAFNNLTPWLWTPMSTLGQTVVIAGQDAVGFYVKLQMTPTTLTGWNVVIGYREIS